jgi:trk system potassium uptake protein TrkH
MASFLNNSTEEYYYWAAPFINFARIILALVSVAAIINLVLQFGFYCPAGLTAFLNRVDFYVIQIYFIQYAIKFIMSRSKLQFLRNHWFETVLAFLIFSEFAIIINLLGFHFVREYFLDINITAATEIYIGAAQILIVSAIIFEAIRYNMRLSIIRFNPSQIAILSFSLVILTGTGLLMLPRATSPDIHLRLIDALFTAASATCVTGLTVVDTGTTFTHFGQIIILIMIQIGGLGIMTLSSFLALFFGQGMGIKDRVFLQEMMNIDKIGFISSLLRNVVIITFIIEMLGAAFLMIGWHNEGWTTRQLIYRSVFHSISAFCNAGFSMFPDSLVRFQGDVPVILTISSLIILGGIGFIVIMDLAGLRMQSSTFKKRYILTVQTKMVLIITGILIVGGTVLLYFLDNTHTGKIRLITAFFNSVTSRTAGFNTIDIGALNISSVILLMMLMFIGASPGSTGGGIKTTTFGVLWASIHAIVTGKNRITIFRRRVPFVVLNRALVVFAFSVAVVFISVFLLSIFEKYPVIDLAFEAVSAFGTVGLSRGITSGLSDISKIIIIFLMFAGRLGTLTIAFAVTAPGDQVQARIEYPSESVMIG